MKSMYENFAAAVHQLDQPTSLALQAADMLEGKLLPHMGTRAQSLNIRHACGCAAPLGSVERPPFNIGGIWDISAAASGHGRCLSTAVHRHW